MYWHRSGQKVPANAPDLREGLGGGERFTGAHLYFCSVSTGGRPIFAGPAAKPIRTRHYGIGRDGTAKGPKRRTRRSLPNLGADPIKWFPPSQTANAAVIPLLQDRCLQASAHAVFTRRRE